MNFNEFKTNPPTKETVPPELRTLSSDWSDDETILLTSLRWGTCPICHYRVMPELNHKQPGVTWYQCQRDPNHLWEVDYNIHTISPFMELTVTE